MESPPKLKQRLSRAERAVNRASAYSSGSDTSTAGSRSTESDMNPAAKRRRHQRASRGNAEPDACAIFIDSIGAVTGSGIGKRAPPPNKTYGKAIKSEPVDGTTSPVSKPAIPLDELFSSTKNSSLPNNKLLANVRLAPPYSTANPSISSPFAFLTSARSSRSSAVALFHTLPPPTNTLRQGPPSKEAIFRPLAPSPQPKIVSIPVSAMHAPPAVSTRSDWSKRKLEGKPGSRVIGRMPAFVTRKQTSAEKAVAASAAVKKKEEEGLAQALRSAERFTRISLIVVIHNDPFATIHVTHTSSCFPIHPSFAERTPTRTSLLYTFNHNDTSMLSIKLASNTIAVPDEISAPYLEKKQAGKSEWLLNIWDAKSVWKV